MATVPVRSYTCTDGELPVIGGYLLQSLMRDLAEFTAYSSKFNGDYVPLLESRIQVASDLVAPESETAELKASTARLYVVLDELPDLINRLGGYIDFAKKDLQVSPDGFGLKVLRQMAHLKDPEGALDSLNMVNKNIKTYKALLVQQGLTEEFANNFMTGADTIARERQLQYKIFTNRRAIVQDNLLVMNTLNDQLFEIRKVGKILYRHKNPAKLKDYTFSYLKNRVRKAAKPDSGKTKVKPENVKKPDNKAPEPDVK